MDSIEINTDAPSDKTELSMPQEKFAITDEGSANWLLRNLREIDEEAATVKGQADARLAELASDRERLMFQFGDQAKAWARSEADRRRRQSVTLAQGSFCFRNAPGRLTLRDREAAFVHARTAHPELITRSEVEHFDTEAYVRQAEETGEMFPGLDSIPAREDFSITFTKKKKGTPSQTVDAPASTT